MRMRSAGVAWAVGMVLLAAGGCGGGETSAPERPAPMVAVEVATRRAIRSDLELTGTVAPERTARLAAQVEGEILSLAAREGDRVRAGQVLVRIDPSRLEAAQAEAQGERAGVEADLEDARRVLERDRALFERRGIGQEELERSETAVRRLEAALARAGARVAGLAAQLADSQVRAPFDGYVLERHVEVGDVVKSGVPLLAIASAGSYVLVQVSEIDLARLGREEPISLDTDSGLTPCQGELGRVRPQVDPGTRTAAIEVAIGNSCTARLLPGMLVKAGLVLDRRDDALGVPAGAVLTRPDGTRRLFVVEEGTAVERRITTGIEGGGWVEVTSGLAQGERVVVSGQERLRDGLAVRIQGEAKGKEKAS